MYRTLMLIRNSTQAIAGIQEKNGFLSCKYTVTVADKNPAEHYYDLPEVCQASVSASRTYETTGLPCVQRTGPPYPCYGAVRNSGYP
jgi:hypothetical protein